MFENTQYQNKQISHTINDIHLLSG